MPHAPRRTFSLARRLAGLGLTVCIAAPVAGAQERVPLDQVMSPQDRAAAGLARLAPAEQAALEAWLTRYTETVVAVTRMASPSPAGQARMTSAEPGVVRSATPGRYVVAPGARMGGGEITALRAAVTPATTQIAGVFDDGALVRLADGSTWEIHVDHRPRTAGWRAGETVILRNLPAASDPLFEAQLENVSAGWQATARPLIAP